MSDFIYCLQEDKSGWINIGPLKDRLGMDALAIAASTNDVCKAVVVMLADRKYVDLNGASLSNLLDILIVNNQPTANALFPGSGPMTSVKKAAIISTPATEYERYRG